MPKKYEQTFESALQKTLDDTDRFIEVMKNVLDEDKSNMVIRLCLHRTTQDRVEVAAALKTLQASVPPQLTLIVDND